MKDNVLWQLYAGNYHPSEANFNQIPKYAELADEVRQRREVISLFQDSSSTEALNELLEKYTELSSIEAYCAFVQGFQLGVQLMHIGMQQDIGLPE